MWRPRPVGRHIPAQLTNSLDNQEDAVLSRVTIGQAAAIGVQRKLARRSGSPIGNEFTPGSRRAEPEGFQCQQYGDGKGIVDFDHIEIAVGDPGHVERAGPRSGSGRDCQVAHLGNLCMGHAFTLTEQPDRRFIEGFGDIGADHDDRATTIGEQAAIQFVQRGRDGAGIKDIFAGKGFTDDRPWG